MDDLLDYFLKWFIPFLCAGLFGLLIKPLIDTFKQGHLVGKQEEWNQLSSELKEEISAKITTEIAGLRQELGEKTDGIRDAILDIHLEKLIQDSINYIEKGMITTRELEDYQERYETYKKLGGNGHLDAWRPKVLSLPTIKDE